MTQLVKDTWDAWLRRALNVLCSAGAFGALAALTTYQGQPAGEKNWEPALVQAGVTAFGAIVQHLRSKPQ